MTVATNVEEKINQLAMLLNVGEEYGQSSIINDLDTLLFERLKKLLEEGSYLDNAKFLNDLQTWKRQLDLYVEYPFLVGKTIVGIVNGGKFQSYYFYKNFLNLDEAAEVYKENQFMPTILIHDNKSTRYIIKNKYHKQQEVDLNNIKLTNLLSWKDKIDVKQFLSNIMIYEKHEYENIVFIDFPLHYIQHHVENKMLMQFCDAILVNVTKNSKYERELKHILQLNYPKLININVERKDEILQTITRIVHQRDKLQISIHNYSADEIKRQLSLLNIENYYVSFKDDLLNKLLIIEKFYLEEVTKTKNLISKFNKDIVLWSNQDESLASLKLMRDNIKSNHLKVQELLQKHQEVRYQIVSKITHIEQMYFKQSEKEILENKLSYLQTYEKNLWIELSMSLIELNELQLAKIYINRLVQVNDSRLCILYLMISQKLGQPYEPQHLSTLKLSPNQDQIIIRSKIRFRKEISLSDEEAEGLALKLDRVISVDEHYLKGLALSKIDVSNGVRKIKYAFERGHMEAGKYLFRLYTDSNGNLREFDLEYLADNMLPEALLEMARRFMRVDKFKYGIIHYKLAIILGSIEALIELANMRYERDDYKGAIPLYEIMVNCTEKCSSEFYEKLGVCYYRNGKYYEAFDMLEKAHTQLAYFYLGMMYEYGRGTFQDYSKGLSYYEKASLSGYNQAKIEYNRLKSEMEQREKRRQSSNVYSSSANYSSKTTTTSTSSHDKWCFLTTATCLALGKGDNCEELQVIRYYRNEYLAFDEDGKQLIYEYYQMAPKIIEKIDCLDNSNQVYISLYRDYIKHVYEYLIRNQYSQAKALYIQMVKDLYKQYELEELAYEIRNRFV
ncbi:SEL1-like repeat protein [Turicibacter sanguinis]|jgi:hypothetical protein|uniref:tetratricopeptide repeat protein n=1 Tax=Turicibacter sanguinis TaxID=154288 RepID=UPI00189AC8A0|nr:SEL1-like repeat protein [Turicibacter sanguinis]MDB8555565.1 SEL1-like repeat protein [Turicibacter sanguinis]